MESDRGSAIVANTTPTEKTTISRIVGAGFSGSEHVGDKAARQRFKLYLTVKLHNHLFCYPTFLTLVRCSKPKQSFAVVKALPVG